MMRSAKTGHYTNGVPQARDTVAIVLISQETALCAKMGETDLEL